MVVRTLQLENEKYTEHFVDVSKESWYNSYIHIAFDNKLVFGVSETEFNPNSTITRQEMTSILGRLIKERKQLNSVNIDTTSKILESLVDNSYIADWAKVDTAILLDTKIVQGYEDGSFQPSKLGTRAESATLICKVITYLGLFK
ncbi:Endoglucanase precursor [compost metagenome]